MTDVLRFVFLELGRFKKHIWELETVFDKWVYLMKHMHKMVEIPKEFNDPMFTRLFLLAETGNFTAEEYEQYKKSLENMGDYQNIINTAVEEATMIATEQGLKNGMEQGLKLGMAEGMAQGMAQARTAIAKRMLAGGMSMEQVMELTELSLVEIRSLSK